MQHFIKVTFFEHFTLFITLVYFFSICNIQYTTKLMFTVVLWLKIKIEIIGIVKSALWGSSNYNFCRTTASST